MNTPKKRKALTGQGPMFVKNNLQQISELDVTIVVDSNGAISNLLIFQGPTPRWMVSKAGCSLADQNHVKLSSSFSANDANGLIDFNKYIEQIGMYIEYIKMTTTTTEIYNGYLYLSEMPPNGLPVPEKIRLSDYAVSGSQAGYNQTLMIADHPISNTKNFSLYISALPASSTLTITFGVSAIGNGFTVDGEA